MANILSSLFENLGIESASERYVHMDWKETPHAHIFQMDLPGLTKNEVKLEVHQGRVLQVTGYREEEEEEEEEPKDQKGTVIWHCRERISTGSFSRQFRLPEDANVDEIKASMHDGVLIVTVPKDEAFKKHSRKAMVQISGDDDGERPHAPKGFCRFVCCKA